MKYTLPPSGYSFNASAKTITFTGVVPAHIGNIMHVANVTRGVIYFQPQAGVALSGSYTSPTLTLNCSTTGHANGDKLLIVYDDGSPLVAVSDNGGSLTVEGRGYTGGPVSFVRPSNTTAYTAGDVIGAADTGTPANAGSAVLEFPTVGPTGGWIRIDAVDFSVGRATLPSGMTGLRLHLYTVAPTAILDNAVFSANLADRLNYRGFIALNTPEAIGAGFLYTWSDYVGRFIRLANGSSSLFGVLQTLGGFTPDSGTAYTVALRSVEVGL